MGRLNFTDDNYGDWTDWESGYSVTKMPRGGFRAYYAPPGKVILALRTVKTLEAAFALCEAHFSRTGKGQPMAEVGMTEAIREAIKSLAADGVNQEGMTGAAVKARIERDYPKLEINPNSFNSTRSKEVKAFFAGNAGKAKAGTVAAKTVAAKTVAAKTVAKPQAAVNPIAAINADMETVQLTLALRDLTAKVGKERVAAILSLLPD